MLQPSAALWADAVARSGTPAIVTHATAFLVDFLPVIRRTLTRTGFVIDHIHYYSDALKPWIARRGSLPAFLIRRDPRDISRIWVLEPDEKHYLEIPCRTLSHPGNELRIPLVGVGTREAYLAIRSDDQLENRFEPIMLPLWEANDDSYSLLASFAASFPLRRSSPIVTPDMARYLLTRSKGTIGCVDLTVEISITCGSDVATDCVRAEPMASL